MKAAWLIFWLAVGTWMDLIVARVSGLVAWPWRWVLAPAWLTALAFVAFVLVAWLLDRAIRIWVFWCWLKDVREARRRSRLWKEIQRRREAGEPTVLLERELIFRHPDGIGVGHHRPGKTS